MPSSFVEKLRMGNIFSPGGEGINNNGNSGEINPDYITAIMNRMVPFEQEKEDREFRRQKEMFQLQNKAHLDNIARQIQTKQPQQQEQQSMAVHYQPSISEYQRGTLGLREQELRQKGELGRGSLDIRRELADNPEQLQSMRGNQALEQIAARLLSQKDLLGTRGEQGIDLQQMRGTQGMEQIGARGDVQKDIQDIRGTQAERLAEDKGWTVSNIVDPDNPNKQIAVRVNNNTGDVQRLKLDEKQVGPVARPSATSAGKLTQPQDLQYIRDKTQETISALNEILNEKGKLKPEMQSAVGKSRMLGMQYIPGSQTRTADATIKRLKDMITLGLLQEMKSRSQTGSTGFGQLNMKELGVLESAASKIDPALSESALEAELVRLREKLKLVLLPEDGFEEVITPRKPTAAELIKRHGG